MFSRPFCFVFLKKKYSDFNCVIAISFLGKKKRRRSAQRMCRNITIISVWKGIGRAGFYFEKKKPHPTVSQTTKSRAEWIIFSLRGKKKEEALLQKTFLHNKTIFAWTFLRCDVFFSPTYNELPPKIRLKSCENYRGLPPPSYFETSTSPLPLLKSILLLPVIKILLFRGAAKNKGGGCSSCCLFPL